MAALPNSKRPSPIHTGWYPSSQPEEWQSSPLRQGLGFISRRQAILSPQVHRASLLSKLRPTGINKALEDERRRLTRNEPGTPMRSSYNPARNEHQIIDTSLGNEVPPYTSPASPGPSPMIVDSPTPHAERHVDVRIPTGFGFSPQHANSPTQLDLNSPPPHEDGPILSDLDLRFASKVISVALLRRVEATITAIGSQTNRLSPKPWSISEQNMRDITNTFQGAAEAMHRFGFVEDLRQLNDKFFDDLTGLLDSIFGHINSGFPHHCYHVQWIESFKAATGAANIIAHELRSARILVAAQKLERGSAQEGS